MGSVMGCCQKLEAAQGLAVTGIKINFDEQCQDHTIIILAA